MTTFQGPIAKNCHSLYTPEVRRRGSTLAEVLVSGFCLLLLLALLTPLLSSTGRILHRSDQDATAQQEALVSIQRFFSLAAYSDGRTLALAPDDSSLCSFLSSRRPQYNPLVTLAPADFSYLGAFTPQITWTKFLFIYWNASARQLRAKEFQYSNQELARVQSDRLASLAYRNDAKDLTISNDIVDFEVRSPRQNQLWIRVKSERKWDVTYHSELTFVVTLRN